MTTYKLAKSLIRTLATFVVFALSHNPYTISNYHRKRPTSLSNNGVQTSIFLKTVSWGKLTVNKLASYGTSGRSAKGKMIVHWSSFYQISSKRLALQIKTQKFACRFWSQTQFLIINENIVWSRLRCVSTRGLRWGGDRAAILGRSGRCGRATADRRPGLFCSYRSVKCALSIC